ncbi:hypothetical protein, partial [Blastococcus sp. KM273129]|uniref:hypothetical protein n=1 Tax=Blastococcus sp. KM273129 TaxID=2570315 RepID=UPI001F248F37
MSFTSNYNGDSMRTSDRLPLSDLVRRRLALAVAVVLAVLSVQVLAVTPASAADPRMYQGPAFATAGPSPTEDKPQSKLWFHD